MSAVHPDVHWPPGWGPDCCDSFVSHERYVAAPADTLFSRLVAVAEWPAWLRGVDRVECLEDLVVGGRFVVVTPPHPMDGIVGELVAPRRFGWAAVSDGLSFYQSWLLLDAPRGGTRTIFQEASRGPSALLRTSDRAALTRSWLDALAPAGC
ncbi:SRPBCC family protein [Amycolatopsis rhabdoformis]|uniref:SRPBCC family protein n=1 Tax=Amycolatopsis rhabdoformis TaxID=1448059 RepID=A0ABZ1IC63_9PSEU|nr:SRPBCC family protein [Amycolatopsis rhabdoformis]WSE32007.1 SRPBCC family protein [Amycolatopsis rhabdoformis]